MNRQCLVCQKIINTDFNTHWARYCFPEFNKPCFVPSEPIPIPAPSPKKGMNVKARSWQPKIS